MFIIKNIYKFIAMIDNYGVIRIVDITSHKHKYLWNYNFDFVYPNLKN